MGDQHVVRLPGRYCVHQRKRLIRSAAYRRRNELVLRLLERFTTSVGSEGGSPQTSKQSYAPYRSRIVWGAVLPQDRSRQVADERALVQAGIHSRRRAADTLGVEDPDTEFARWLEEERRARPESAPAAGGNHERPPGCTLKPPARPDGAGGRRG